MMRGLALDFKNSVYLDSICVFFCIANMIMLLRKLSEPIDQALNAIQSGAGLKTLLLVVWLFQVIGLACFNLLLYGPLDERYSSLLVSVIHTFYNPGILDIDFEFSTVYQFFWNCVIWVMFYFLNVIFIISAMQAIVVKEYNFNLKANSEPAVNEKGEYVVNPEQPPELSLTLKQSWKDFVLWAVNWLPDKMKRRFEQNEEDA